MSPSPKVSAAATAAMLIGLLLPRPAYRMGRGAGVLVVRGEATLIRGSVF